MKCSILITVIVGCLILMHVLLTVMCTMVFIHCLKEGVTIANCENNSTFTLSVNAIAIGLPTSSVLIGSVWMLAMAVWWRHHWHQSNVQLWKKLYFWKHVFIVFLLLAHYVFTIQTHREELEQGNVIFFMIQALDIVMVAALMHSLNNIKFTEPNENGDCLNYSTKMFHVTMMLVWGFYNLWLTIGNAIYACLKINTIGTSSDIVSNAVNLLGFIVVGHYRYILTGFFMHKFAYVCRNKDYLVIRDDDDPLEIPVIHRQSEVTSDDTANERRQLLPQLI